MSSRRRTQRNAGEEECFYSILGLSRECSDDDVRRAYKKLAVRFHPDKNPNDREAAEIRFKAVAEAYEVLSDPGKRSRYDRYGRSGLNGSTGGGGGGGGSRAGPAHDPFDLFRSFFGGRDPFASFFDDDDAFGSSMGRTRSSAGGSPFGSSAFGGSPFGSAFGGSPFGGGFGGFGMMDSMMGDMMSMSMGGGGFPMQGGSSVSMSTMSFGGGPSKSVSQQTVIRDGKKITRTVTRTTQPDGTVHEDVEESINEHSQSAYSQRPTRISGGQSSRRRLHS
ncbi:Chaperone protein DnaJ [Diplonema papillatum]|nr:Chaperone protein DnaJ [Diplonema papillatum]